MRPFLRIGFIVGGLAGVVYGTASLTGGWLGAPPWWDCVTGYVTHSTGFGPVRADGTGEPFCVRRAWEVPPIHRPRASDSSIGGGVVVAGAALSMLGGWPRRRRACGAA